MLHVAHKVGQGVSVLITRHDVLLMGGRGLRILALLLVRHDRDQFPLGTLDTGTTFCTDDRDSLKVS